jgi:competence protein ComEC
VVAESVAVPLAAHLATLPVVAAIAGTVSVVGLLANALAGPFVGPATVLGFAAAGASLASSHLAAALGFGAAWSGQVIIWVAHAGARLPGASWQWPTSALPLVWLGVVSVLAGLLMTYVLARRWLSLLLAATMVAGLAAAPVQPGWPPRDWRLVGCDVGQGDGLVLRAGRSSAVVFDSGPDPLAMRRCLDSLRVEEVPLLVLTHFHADHVDGLAGVFAGRRVRQIWVSPLSTPLNEAAAVWRRAAAARTAVATPAPGTHATVGAVTVDVLGPVPHSVAEEDESSVQNDESLVLRAQVSGLRVLMTGDVEPPGQQAILASGADLRADVLKIPHHGSARQDPAFFAATRARLAIASAGLHNDYGHPAPRTVQLVHDLGMILLRTDTDGAVAVTERDGRLGAVTQRRP